VAKALMQRIRSKRRRESIAVAAKAEIMAEMEKDVKPRLVKSMENVVKDWDTEIGFQARTVVKPDSISVYVYPTGKNKKIFIYVDKGTKRHDIPAKNAPRLAFYMGADASGKPVRGRYEPKTLAKPARTVVGGGYVKPPKTFVRPLEVDHPGSEGREFTKQIAKDIRPEFKAGIDAAFKRAARRSNGS